MATSANRDLADLHSYVRYLAETFVGKCAAVGVTVLITETYRTAARQRELLKNGATKAGPGESYHNYGLAFDFVPMIGKTPAWDRDDLWQTCGSVAEALGLEWGARWPEFPDRPHLQFTGGLSIPDLQKGKKLPTMTIPKEFTPPEWAKDAITWGKETGIMREVTGESMPDYRVVTVLHNFAKWLGKTN